MFRTLTLTQANCYWVIACSLCIPASIAIGRSIGFTIGFTIGIYKFWIIGLILGLITTGMLVGISQWLILRTLMPRAHRWIWATSLGWIAGSIVTTTIGNTILGIVNLALFANFPLTLVWTISGAIGGATGGATGGAISAFIQCLLLRKTIPHADRWILISSCGWAVSSAAMSTVDLASVGAIGLIASWIIYGAIYGAITAKILSLFKHTIS